MTRHAACPVLSGTKYPFQSSSFVVKDVCLNELIENGCGENSLNQVGVQLLDPRARAGGKSALQHRSLRLRSLRLRSLRLNSLHLNSLHLNSHLYPLPSSHPNLFQPASKILELAPSVRVLTTHQKHSVANARPS